MLTPLIRAVPAPSRRSSDTAHAGQATAQQPSHTRASASPERPRSRKRPLTVPAWGSGAPPADLAEKLEPRSEEHTSELQSLIDLVCSLLLDKKTQRWKGFPHGTPHRLGCGLVSQP